jgi:hypothetical protein
MDVYSLPGSYCLENGIFVLFIVAKHAGTSNASYPYPVAMRVASPDSQ